ncbi:MAG: UDP-N-acetylglucosamine-peptide N-acetylglucosaminyltransferase [Ardenticatenaceae bacterium]
MFNQSRFNSHPKQAIALQPEDLLAVDVFRKPEEALVVSRNALNFMPQGAIARCIYERARAQLCEWEGRHEGTRRLHEVVATSLAQYEPTPLTPNHAIALPVSPQEQLAIARRSSQQVAQRMAAQRERLNFTHRATEHSPLRIAYMSKDFCDHATSHLTRSLYGLHNRHQFEIFVYSYGPDDGSWYRKEIAQAADHFVDVASLSPIALAEQIHADGIDILVDLVGYNGTGRLETMALRPAPIQVFYLGFPATTGAEFIDYFITDPVSTPPEYAPFFSEQLVYMPHTYQINDYRQPICEKPVSRAAEGLPEEGFIFCCFNAHYKIDPEIFSLWMGLLLEVPNSVLWLAEGRLISRQNLRQEAQKRGIEPERLIFGKLLPKAEHLARLRLADLFLDTPICNAHTTASDALWAGVPLITCPGETFASRVAASLLTAANLPELIVANLAQYQRLALNLACHASELQQVRDKLAIDRKRGPLFDTPRFVGYLEQAYQAMWERHLTGQKAQPIVIRE